MKAITDFGAQLQERVKDVQRIFIFITQIDPDAIGSAVLMRLLLTQTCNITPEQITIIYGGAISHPQNECIFNLFDLDTLFTPVANEIIKNKTDVWILVDSNCLIDGRFPFSLEGVDIIVDHHKASNGEKKILSLIEPVGSASTLMTELLLASCNIAQIADDQEVKKSLTLGAIGIHNDTNSFTSALTTSRDISAFAALMPYVSMEMLTTAEDYPLKERYLQILKRIVNSYEIDGQIAIASTGYISDRDSDQLAEAAELLIRLNSIRLAVVWGIIEAKNIIRIRLRCQSTAINLNHEIRTVFGDKGGSKQARGFGKGGVELTLGDLGPIIDDPDYKEALLRVLGLLIKSKVSKILQSN